MTVVEQLAEVWQRVARGLSCNCLLPHAAQTSDAPHGAAFALLRGEDDRERDETPSTNERGMRRPTGWAVPVRNNMADVSAGDAGHSAHLRNFGGGSAFDGGDGGMGSQGNAARAEEGEAVQHRVEAEVRALLRGEDLAPWFLHLREHLRRRPPHARLGEGLHLRDAVGMRRREQTQLAQLLDEDARCLGLG